jgi:hypothetical protein
MAAQGMLVVCFALCAQAPEGQVASAINLESAMARSLENVRVVQASVATRTATVARFEALKHFVPLSSLPQLVVGLAISLEGLPVPAFSRMSPAELPSSVKD